MKVPCILEIEYSVKSGLETKPSPIKWDEAEFLQNSKNNISESHENIVKH